MAWAHAQAGLGAQSNAGATSKAITPVATGNLVIVGGISDAGISNITISDTQGWTFNEFIPLTSQTSAGSLRCWWAKTPNTTANTITVTRGTGGSGTFACVLLDEFSGSTATSPFDLKGTAGSASATASASVTPSVDNCLIYEVIIDSATGVGAGYSAGGSDGVGEFAGYKFLSTSTAGVTQTSAWTGTSGASLVGIASFKIVDSGTSPALVLRPARQTRKLIRVPRSQTRQPVLPQAAVNTNQPAKVNVSLRRAQWRVTRKGRQFSPVPPQGAANSNQPPKMWQAWSRRKFGLPRHGQGAEPPWSQQTPAVTVRAPERVGSARVARGLLRVRRAQPNVPHPQHRTPPQTLRRRLLPLLPARRHEAEVPHGQTRPLPSAPQRPRKAISPPRGQAITPVPVQTVVVTATARPIDRQGSRVQRALWTVRRRVVGILANTVTPDMTGAEWFSGRPFTDWETGPPRTEWDSGYPFDEWVGGTVFTDDWTTQPPITGWDSGQPQTDS